MIVAETIAVAFAMFSALPVPQPVWNEKNMRFALCAFSLVGVVIGALCALWCIAAARLAMPPFLTGAGLCLIPIVVTGGIHLDGYADTSDALASFAPQEKKLEILKDAHCGAFAVIRLMVYGIASLALYVTLTPTARGLLCLGGSFVLSRTLSALALTLFPMAKNSGLAHTFATAADKKTVRVVLLLYAVLTTVLLLYFGRLTGVLVLLMAVAAFVRYRIVAMREFGGVSGDLAGWFLQKAELWMLAGLVFGQLLEAMGWYL